MVPGYSLNTDMCMFPTQLHSTRVLLLTPGSLLRRKSLSRVEFRTSAELHRDSPIAIHCLERGDTHSKDTQGGAESEVPKVLCQVLSG